MQQQQQEQQQRQSVSDSCLAFSRSFPANVIWAEEGFAALANACYEEREKKNLPYIVFESGGAANWSAFLSLSLSLPKGIIDKISKDLKDWDPLSNLRAKRYEIIVFCRTQMCGGLSHPVDRANSSAVASRCPACWTWMLKNIVEKQQMAPTLPRRGCCIWPRRLCQWHVLHVLYIAICIAECPATDHIERPVALLG